VKLGNLDLADRYLDSYCRLEAFEEARSAAPQQIVPWFRLPEKTKIVLWQLGMAKDAFQGRVQTHSRDRRETGK
jgi:hypothetical protein